jgi:protein phosphatase
MELKFASQTHTGMVRFQNEDAMALVPDCGVVILADGMGGYNAGEVASGMATAILKKELATDLIGWPNELSSRDSEKLHLLVQTHISNANEVIFHASEIQPQYAGMGTTLVLAVFRNQTLTVAHIGDSRMYRLRGNALAQLTRDHSLLQDQIDAGMVTPEQARQSLNKNLVTRALGVDPVVEAEIRDYQIQPNDLYLLCSDGLTDMMTDHDIKDTLQLWSHDLDVMADKLINQANERGGRDNISVILVQVQPQTQILNHSISKFMSWLK